MSNETGVIQGDEKAIYDAAYHAYVKDAQRNRACYGVSDIDYSDCADRVYESAHDQGLDAVAAFRKQDQP